MFLLFKNTFTDKTFLQAKHPHRKNILTDSSIGDIPCRGWDECCWTGWLLSGVVEEWLKCITWTLLFIRLSVSRGQPRTQRQGPFGAEDVLKFIVSTDPVYGTKSLELPDLWDVLEHDAAAVRSADETFGAPVQKSLLEKNKGLRQLKDEKTITNCAFRSITIRTVLEVN